MKKYLIFLFLSVNCIQGMNVEKESVPDVKSNGSKIFPLTRRHVPSLSNKTCDTFYVYYQRDGKRFYDYVQDYKDGSSVVHATYEIADRPS